MGSQCWCLVHADMFLCLGSINRGLGIVCWNVVRQVSERKQRPISSRQRLVVSFSQVTAGSTW